MSCLVAHYYQGVSVRRTKYGVEIDILNILRLRYSCAATEKYFSQ